MVFLKHVFPTQVFKDRLILAGGNNAHSCSVGIASSTSSTVSSPGLCASSTSLPYRSPAEPSSLPPPTISSKVCLRTKRSLTEKLLKLPQAPWATESEELGSFLENAEPWASVWSYEVKASTVEPQSQVFKEAWTFSGASSPPRLMQLCVWLPPLYTLPASSTNSIMETSASPPGQHCCYLYFREEETEVLRG